MMPAAVQRGIVHQDYFQNPGIHLRKVVFGGTLGRPLLNLPDFLTDAEMSVTFCLQALERSKAHVHVFVPFVGYELPRMMLMHGCLHFNTL